MKYFIRHLMDLTHNERNRTQNMRWIAADAGCAFVMFFCTSVIFGYMTDKHYLYGDWVNDSPRMALSTAVCTLILAVSVLIYHREK